MQILAVIDVGSTALRMAIGEHLPGRPVRRLETLEVPVAIGLDAITQGRIRSVTTEAVISTLQDFSVVLQSYGLAAASVRAVATTAVRDARNRVVFLDRVERGCGICIEVIEAVEEIRLVHQYLRLTLGDALDRGTSMLLSLGAGGTQVIVQREGAIVFEETLHFGMLRLGELAGDRLHAPVAARRFLGKVVRAIQRVQELSEVTSLVVVSKEVFRLAERAGRGEATTAGLVLRRKELERLHKELAGLTPEELHHRFDMDHTTAERGPLALEELLAFTRATAAQAVIVPGASMLDSLLLDAALATLDDAGEYSRHSQIEHALRALGRRYSYDEAHSLHVRELALQLFDGLLGLTHLPPRSRLLLNAAAILHDIGYYVSPREHERHSHYLISASEVMGFNLQEQGQIALVARLHRRPFSAVGLPEMERLPAAQRVEVLKLGSLLSLAEALDQDHRQLVKRVQVQLKGETLRVLAETRAGDREDFAFLVEIFGRKSELFAEVFGIEPRLSEVLAR